MMNAGLFVLMFNAAIADPADDLKRDMKALELYLQDQKDHKEYCSNLKWDQPVIEVYKKTLKTQLPAGCKK